MGVFTCRARGIGDRRRGARRALIRCRHVAATSRAGCRLGDFQLDGKGFIRCLFRPRVGLNALFPFVDKLRIDLAGWRFPFVPDTTEPMKNGTDPRSSNI
jgi:hypothetical protein